MAIEQSGNLIFSKMANNINFRSKFEDFKKSVSFLRKIDGFPSILSYTQQTYMSQTGDMAIEKSGNLKFSKMINNIYFQTKFDDFKNQCHFFAKNDGFPSILSYMGYSQMKFC